MIIYIWVQGGTDKLMGGLTTYWERDKPIVGQISFSWGIPKAPLSRRKHEGWIIRLGVGVSGLVISVSSGGEEDMENFVLGTFTLGGQHEQ